MAQEEEISAEEARIEEAVQHDGIAISVRNLRNSFGDQVVHEGLNLDVRKGEILGVVGGSGTGKSVLMRSIIGLQTPDEGEIRSEERRVGKEGVGTGRSGWSPYH